MGLNVAILLPFSRDHESEADQPGMELAARAGIEVWQRMHEKSGGRQPPEFLSTRPSHETRIENMRKRLTEVLPLHERAQGAGCRTAGEASHPRPRAFNTQAAGFQPARTEAGHPALVSEFKTDQDVRLERVRVEGPEGMDVRFDARTSITADRPIRFSVWARNRGPRMPPGEYIMTFVGEQSGRPFTSAARYVVQQAVRTFRARSGRAART